MNTNDVLTKLIAEIERRIIEHRKSLKKDVTSISEAMLKGSLGAYESIEHFIASLQQEQPEVDLGKDIDAFFDKWDKNSNGGIFDENGAPVTIKTIKGAVKHFLNVIKE